MHLLLVEDDQRAAQAIARGLQEHGFTVEVAHEGLAGLDLAQSRSFDLLVLDVGLPGLDGFALLKRLREDGSGTPVIFLTARGGLQDRVQGLELGGGDYLVKPFAFSELLVRVQNLLRRPGVPFPEKLVLGDLEILPRLRRVSRANQRLDLTPQEYALLELLARNEGRVVTRTRIAEELWGVAFDRDPNLVDAVVKRLRRKVDAPSSPSLIQTRRGIGYLLEVPGA
ncbi:response regulator transcription factor [Geothrix mesophila]|uniref:response regulator n=1 Tax=Geothrix mesophila TaxID=2922723 RepID=UPI001FAD003F|nr:response regulator transcription factor [Geothrix sp. SG198]